MLKCKTMAILENKWTKILGQEIGRKRVLISSEKSSNSWQPNVRLWVSDKDLGLAPGSTTTTDAFFVMSPNALDYPNGGWVGALNTDIELRHHLGEVWLYKAWSDSMEVTVLTEG